MSIFMSQAALLTSRTLSDLPEIERLRARVKELETHLRSVIELKVHDGNKKIVETINAAKAALHRVQ